jgi:pimeloyl-ACP methyl ester carboxylesterase
MPYVDVGDTHLFYEESGEGEPVVFVHGNWSQAATWGQTLPELPETLRAITYDRRGSGRSGRGTGELTRRRHEHDLAAVIEALGPAPAHVVGNSYGASIALGLAACKPELFRSIVAHEPPLPSVVTDGRDALAAVARTHASLRVITRRVEAGDAHGGAEQFVEEVSLGPGGWAKLPYRFRSMMIANAPTVAEELRDPAWQDISLRLLAELDVPVLLTQGDQSPMWFLEVVCRLYGSTKEARVATIKGAGHNPHATHPAAFAAAVAAHAEVGEALR